MTSVPPAQPPAAPETDVRLTEAERTILTAHFWGRRITANATHLADLIAPAVERIVAERVRVVESERDALMRASWLAYERSGADTDGDKQWHCAPEMAGRALVHAVETLRKDYDDSLDESESAEAAHRALQAAVEALAEKWEGRESHTPGAREHADALRALLAGGAR